MRRKLIVFIGIFSIFFMLGFSKNQAGQSNIVNDLIIPAEFNIGKLDEEEELIRKISYKKIKVNSLDDIFETPKKEEELFVFSNVNVDLRKLPAEKRKEAFVNLLLPAINVVHEEIKTNKDIIGKLAVKSELTEEEKAFAEGIFKKYKVTYGNWQELESKMVIYPASLILTQGAIESAWGTSRFFREANNIFGMWSTNPNEPRIAAKGVRANGFVPHLRKYDTIKESVEDIVLTISRADAYKGVRKLLNEDKPAKDVAYGLVKYSEEGEAYVRKVRKTLEINEFYRYDS